MATGETRNARRIAGDADLVAACRAAGTAGEAFRELVERYKGAVMGCAYGILRDRHEAEDVSQETFVRAYRALGDLRDPAGFSSWLLVIARNAARTRAARRMRQGARAGDAAGPDAAEREPGDRSLEPSDAASRNELYALVMREVDEIPDMYRRTVYLRFVKGLTCREIADADGIQVGVVTSRLTRATAMLREKLARRTGERRP